MVELGPYLQSQMRVAVGDHPLVGEVRGLGFMPGIELVRDRSTKTPFPRKALVGRRLLKILFARGLISRALGLEVEGLATPVSPQAAETRDDFVQLGAWSLTLLCLLKRWQISCLPAFGRRRRGGSRPSKVRGSIDSRAAQGRPIAKRDRPV